MNRALKASSGFLKPVNAALLSEAPMMPPSRLISLNEIRTMWPRMLAGIFTLSAKSWKNAPLMGMNS